MLSLSRDRTGQRPVMLRISLWWSFFMAATGRTAGCATLCASQLIFGGGAAGVYPGVARSFATFLQPRERARAQGLIWLGARWGGAATPIVMAILFRYFDWRGSFTALSCWVSSGPQGATDGSRASRNHSRRRTPP